jgi:predicted Holliday junction resolvase-like endonuclease
MDSFDILVIILAVTLTIFLVLAIILMVVFIKLIQKVNSMADKVELTAQNIVDASDAVKRYAAPAAIAQILTKLIKR